MGASQTKRVWSDHKHGPAVATAFHIRLLQSHIRRSCKQAVTPVQATSTNHKQGPVYFTSYHLTMLPFHLHDRPQCLPSPSHRADDVHTEGKLQGLGALEAGFYRKKLWSITPRTDTIWWDDSQTPSIAVK